MAKVNLDALIAREDFEVEENVNSGKKKESISIEDMKGDSFFFSNLRKPDFQRETNEWDAQKIFELIKSFVEGDLIPAIILWRSTGGYLFIIDGCHRLSALSAWVNNDYGDGKISKLFYDGIIPDEQLEIGQETRKLVNKSIGSYDDFRLALSHPDKVNSDVIRYAKNLGALAIQLQWVEGDAHKAENSFFKINQQAAPINKTELKLLESRKKPNSIAARAIIRSGKGHKYWSYFPTGMQQQVQELAAEINGILFHPQLQTPIKTLDIPIGGNLYSAQTLPLVLDFINIVCVDNSTGKAETPDDNDGEATINTLKRIRKVAYRLNSNHTSSLGLHPAVYFYSQDGRHKTASFFAMVDFIINLDKRKSINNFILVREKFEDFILQYDYLIQQINRKYRIAQKSYPYISSFFQKVVALLGTGMGFDKIINEIIADKGFNYLTFQKASEQPSLEKAVDFSSNKKSAIYIQEALQKAPRCGICGGAYS